MQNQTPTCEQLKCIQAPLGTYLIHAGFGSGKTYTLIKRIEYLFNQAILLPHQKILCLTYTNKAANDMKRKIIEFFSEDLVNEKLWIGTFHSFYYYIFLHYGQLVSKISSALEIPIIPSEVFIPTEQSIKLELVKIKKYKIELLKGYAEKCDLLNPETFLNKKKDDYHIYQFRDFCNSLHCDGECAKECEFILFESIIDIFLNQKMITFDLLEYLAVQFTLRFTNLKKILNAKFPIILVDEFQDCNDYQLKFLITLWNSQKQKNLMVVGDENQSIYRFRGSIPSIFDVYSKLTSPAIYMLTKNFRNPVKIQILANKLLEDNLNITAVLDELKDDNDIIVKNFDWRSYYGSPSEKREEIFNDKIRYLCDYFKRVNPGITLSNICIFAFRNEDVMNIVNKLKELHVPVSIFAINNSYFDEFEKFCGYLQYLVNSNLIFYTDLNPNILLKLDRLNIQNLKLHKLVKYILENLDCNLPADLIIKINEFSLKFEYEDKYKTKQNNLVEYLNHLRLSISIEDLVLQNEDEIRVSTHHKGKGLEFDVVIFFDLNSVAFNFPKDLEFKRLAHVTIGRTKKCVMILN